jgi:phosphodiesterase/alkaline phosphatase D-like protein
MRASPNVRANLTLLTTNKMPGGQQLFGSNNLVVAGREHENWASYYRVRLPAIYGFREFAEAGGLMSYGANLPNVYRQSARRTRFLRAPNMDVTCPPSGGM